MGTSVYPVHGGLNLVELRSLGVDPSDVLDFSASINPLGLPHGVVEAMAKVDITTYPDRQCLKLREALAAHLNVELAQILVGNGSTELIHLLARAYLSKDDRAFIFAPTFGEYEAACMKVEAAVYNFKAKEATGFHWDLDAGLSAIQEQDPRLVFLCNPNNPTGIYLDQAAVESIARALESSSLLVLDEAYVPLAEEPWDSLPLLQRRNIVLLRSMTKDYAMPGLRVGYMLAFTEVVQRVHQFQPSWSVNAVAQAAASAALEHRQYLERAREAIVRSKRYLEGELQALGLVVVPSSANFLLVKVGDASSLRLKLLRCGICVRDCTSFGLPQHIRIGMRKLEECQRLITALKEVLTHG